MILLVLAAAAVAIAWWSYRAHELFRLSVRNGRILVVSGRIPASLLHDFRAVVASPPVARATISAHREAAGARLSVTGTADAGQEQRLRNIFHAYPQSRLRAAPRPRQQTIGQIFGLAWLAWLLERHARHR